MRVMSIFDWIIRLAGTGALVLGLLIWTLHLDVVSVHVLFGLVVALCLLVISLLSTFTPELRLAGLIGIVYAFILPLLGLNQEALLVGSLHWLVEVLHLLVGIGALAFAGVLSMRYRRVRLAKM